MAYYSGFGSEKEGDRMIAAIIMYVVSIFTIIMCWMVCTPVVFEVLDALADAFVGTHAGWINWFIGSALKTGYSMVYFLMLGIVTWWLFLKSQQTEVVYGSRRQYVG